MEAEQRPASRILYPVHTARWSLRSVASLFLLLAFSLYLADGVACDNAVNAFNNSGEFYGSATTVCWTDPLYGDLRPLLIVRTRSRLFVIWGSRFQYAQSICLI
jgi:hypothetical protein